jgi:hypothetical protein
MAHYFDKGRVVQIILGLLFIYCLITLPLKLYFTKIISMNTNIASFPLETESSATPENVSQKRLFTILLWTDYFAITNWGLSALGKTPFEFCPSSGDGLRRFDTCTVTTDKTRILEADVVVFHCRNVINKVKELLKNRLPRHIFVMMCMESPVHANRLFKVADRIGECGLNCVIRTQFKLHSNCQFG